MIKLTHLLAQEQETLKYQMEQQMKRKKSREAGLAYVNVGKSSSLLSKASVVRDASMPTINRLKIETMHLPQAKPPLKRVHKQFNISQRPTTVIKEDQKQQILNQAHFLCSMMQESKTEKGQKVQNFLNGQLEKNSYESILSMEYSAQALQTAAKEMSKTLYYEGEEQELQNLKDKFIDQIRLSKFRPHQNSTIIFKRNYSQKYEMLIDQVGRKTRKKTDTEQGDYDIFIPKSEMDYFINQMQQKIDNRMKQQKDELLKDEQKLVTNLVNNVKQYKEDLREVTYTMNHLRIRKKPLKTILKSSPSIQLQSEGRVNQNQRKMDDEQKADLKLRVIKALRNFVDKLKRFNISISEVLNNQIFPSCPYERPLSKEFFDKVKETNIYEVELMLRDCRFHVYDIDNQLKTALHHAAASKSIELVKLLFENGADLDSRDMMGRTPLHLAAKNNNSEAVRALLVYGANPSIKTIAGKRPYEMTDLPVIKALINNARKLHFMMDLQPYKNRKDFWLQRAIQYFQDDDPEKILKLQLYKAQSKLFL